LTSPEAAADPDPFYVKQFPDFSSVLPGQLRVFHGLEFSHPVEDAVV